MGLGGQPFGTQDTNGGSGDMGINQLTSDVTAGPGTGSQVATIAANAVTSGKIAANAVTSTKIADANVTEAKIADGAVTENKIQPEAVTLGKLAPNSVGTNNILNNAVGYDKMQQVIDADGAVLGATTTGPVTEIPCRAPARTIGAAADMEEVRDAIGIRDIGDFRNFAIAQAKQRLGLSTTQFPQVVVDQSFLYPPGYSFNNTYPTSTKVGTRVLDLNGAWARLDNTGLSGAETYAYPTYNGGGSGAVPMGIDLTSGPKWYLAFYGRLPDGAMASGSMAGFEFLNYDFSLDGPTFPCKGVSSAAKFSLTASDGDFAESTVDLDSDVHLFEVWGGGLDSTVFMSVDQEGGIVAVTEPHDLSAWMVRLRVAGTNGEFGDSMFDYGHLVVIVAGNE